MLEGDTPPCNRHTEEQQQGRQHYLRVCLNDTYIVSDAGAMACRPTTRLCAHTHPYTHIHPYTHTHTHTCTHAHTHTQTHTHKHTYIRTHTHNTHSVLCSMLYFLPTCSKCSMIQLVKFTPKKLITVIWNAATGRKLHDSFCTATELRRLMVGLTSRFLLVLLYVYEKRNEFSKLFDLQAVCVCVCACVCVHEYACVCVCVYASAQLYVSVFMHVCASVCMCVDVLPDSFFFFFSFFPPETGRQCTGHIACISLLSLLNKKGSNNVASFQDSDPPPTSLSGRSCDQNKTKKRRPILQYRTWLVQFTFK